MVGVAQLAERKNVALQVAGSNPVTHPRLDAQSKRSRQRPKPHLDHWSGWGFLFLGAVVRGPKAGIPAGCTC